MVLSCPLIWTQSVLWQDIYPWCVCVCTAQSRECHNTDYVHINEREITITVILVKHCIKLPDDGSFVIRNMLEQF